MPVYLTLPLMLVLAALLCGVLAIWLMAKALLCPPRMTDGKAVWVLKRLSPGDLNLPFQFQWFRVRDEATGQPLRLASWWIPNPNAHGRCIVLVHGYADAKVGAIAWAPLLHGLGYNLLVPDMRAHGESEGRAISAGYWERHDLNQLINQLRTERPSETRHLVLYGLSLGAAVVCGAAALRDDLAGVILDCPAADERHAAMAQFDLMGLPGPFLQRQALRLASWWAGFDFEQARPAANIPQIRCPLLMIQSGQDPYVPPADLQTLASAAQSRPQYLDTQIWLAPDAPHLLALATCPDEYERRVAEFLSRLTTPAYAG